MSRGKGAAVLAWPGPASLLVCLALAPPLVAEQLPLRTYRDSDGLPPGQVRVIHQDSRGYLWIATSDGLSRFDGRRFVSYGLEDGLPHVAVTTIAEDSRGRLWVGTYGGGLARLDGEASRRFRAFPTDPPQVLSVGVADDGAVVWTSVAGLHRGRETESGWVTERLSSTRVLLDQRGKPAFCPRVVRGAGRELWLGLGDQVVAVEAGHVTAFGPAPDEAGQPVLGIARGDGTVLAVYSRATLELRHDPGAGRSEVWTHEEPAPTGVVYTGAWARGAGDRVFLGALEGVVRSGHAGRRRFTSVRGVRLGAVYALATERQGALWIGAEDSLSRLAPEADATLTEADGLAVSARKVVEGQDGRIYAAGDGAIFEVSGGRAVPVTGSQHPPFDRASDRFLCDRRGDWWIGTDEGLFRFRGPRLQLRKGEMFGPREGMTAAGIAHAGLYEDPRGGIWVAGRDGFVYHLDAAHAAHPAFRRLPPRPASGNSPPSPAGAMALDRAGGLWAAGYDGRLARFANGQWRAVSAEAGLPSTNVRALLSDSRGRLWLGLRFNGAVVTDDPAAPRPRFVNHSTRTGLLSDAVRALAEDRFGRMYLATARGVARLDPATGTWRHFGAGDGLADDRVFNLCVDRRSGVWVATVGGLTRFDLAPPGRGAPALTTYLLRVHAAGADLPLPAWGAVTLPPLTLPASSGLSVEFTAPQFETESTRFEYRLTGSGDEGWSEPQTEGALTFARLAPGGYGFAVRALDADGRPSASAATLSLRVLAPFWRRPAPQGAAFLALSAVVFAAHRWRVSRALALERLRRQIATDLHDDVGSGLTEIALLSEVVRRGSDKESQARLATVADLARSLRESMSDIVWAVDPRRDRLADLVDRMRQVAFHMAEGEGMRVDFEVPEAEALGRLELAPDRKRHLLLAFKEAMSNVVRHSKGGQARVRLEVRGRRLVLIVSDDGRGFDPRKPSSGLGLASLQRRAVEIGGSLDVASAPGNGTTLRLEVPVGRSGSSRSRRS